MSSTDPRVFSPIDVDVDLDKLAEVCRAVLRQTPEYEEVKRLSSAREWLRSEGMSMAYLLQEAIHARLDDLDPPEGYRT